MCTESSKGPNIHVRVAFDKFHAVVHPLNPAEFNLQVLDKKQQQYVLNYFIKICCCK